MKFKIVMLVTLFIGCSNGADEDSQAPDALTAMGGAGGAPGVTGGAPGASGGAGGAGVAGSAGGAKLDGGADTKAGPDTMAADTMLPSTASPDTMPADTMPAAISGCLDIEDKPAAEGAVCKGAGTSGICHANNCCTGCWDGTTCHAGKTDDACGSAGAMCRVYPAQSGWMCGQVTQSGGKCRLNEFMCSGKHCDGSAVVICCPQGYLPSSGKCRTP